MNGWNQKALSTLSPVPSCQGGPEGLRIGVLGPLASWRDGAQLALGPSRQRAVLALLALHDGVGLHRDVIIDALWGDQPPGSAVQQVQAYICQLRKVLGAGYTRGQRAGAAGAAGELVSTLGPGYRMAAGPGQLDLTEFSQLCHAAASAAARADLPGACARYEQALGLWRGEPLADVDPLAGHPIVVELGRRHADTVVRYAEAAGSLGAHGRVIPYLRGLCARERLNEEAHAHLMRALAATGQQAAALNIFAELRHRLDEELGIRPSAILQQAHGQVLRQECCPPGRPELVTMRWNPGRPARTPVTGNKAG